MACTYRRFEPRGFVNDGGSLTRFRHHAPHPSLGGLPRRQDRSLDAQIHFGRRRQNDPSKAGGSQKQTALMGRLLAERVSVKTRAVAFLSGDHHDPYPLRNPPSGQEIPRRCYETITYFREVEPGLCTTKACRLRVKDLFYDRARQSKTCCKCPRAAELSRKHLIQIASNRTQITVPTKTPNTMPRARSLASLHRGIPHQWVADAWGRGHAADVRSLRGPLLEMLIARESDGR